MKKQAIIALALGLGLAAASAAQPVLRDAPGHPPFELSLFGGIGLSQIKGTTNYEDQWGPYSILRSVSEQTAIATNAKMGFAGGGSLAYYFSPNFGLQALFSYMKADVPNAAVTDFSWTWLDGSSYTKTGTWPGTGSFSSMPFSLDLVGKFGAGAFEAHFSGGVTMFVNTFEQNSFFGYGVTTIQGGYQYIDALQVGLQIPSGTLKRTAFGANVGAGFTINFSDMIGLRADARYYYCPEQVVTWNFLLGNYDGTFFGDIANEPFAEADVQLLQDLGKTFEMTVNPSFIQLSLGLVFRFGGIR